ncbi:MFS transporter [Paenibacillus abyssi]|uniref:MFS transporter n=1 Tax=Paenibacillus abyssi TaxID=1340531 RepID=A0A917G0G0_9BACL|nr:MFS transporter [Paenibacillus abyssi]GGG16485.1 hypothetical protein GCM10010916_36710 [Paenibacillus abyssi]
MSGESGEAGRNGGGFSGEVRVSLLNHGIYQFGNALAVVLVHLYLWRLTNDMWVNGAFNLITLLAAPLASVYIGKIAKLKDRLLAYRLGIYMTALFYCAILLAGERMVDYYVWFALLKGISAAFYWLGHFTMITDLTDDDNRHRYLGLNLIITNLAMLAGPAAAGLIVGNSDGFRGYTCVFMLAFAMFAYASFNSLKMKKNSSHHKTYYLKYTILMIRKYPVYGRSLAGWFLFGLPQGVLAYIPAILLYQAVPKESFVNYMNVLFLSVTILSGYLLAKRGRVERNSFYLKVSAWGFIVGAAVLFFGISLWSVILFMLLFSFMKPIQNNAYTSYYYKLSGELPLREHFKVEAVVLREVFTNAGRAAGVALLMLAPGQMETGSLSWVLMLAAVLQLVIGRLAASSAPAKTSDNERRLFTYGPK